MAKTERMVGWWNGVFPILRQSHLGPIFFLQTCGTSLKPGVFRERRHVDIFWLVVWNMAFMTFHILGIISPTDFHIFQRGRSTTNQFLSDIFVVSNLATHPTSLMFLKSLVYRFQLPLLWALQIDVSFLVWIPKRNPTFLESSILANSCP